MCYPVMSKLIFEFGVKIKDIALIIAGAIMKK
jgi:hypothetical protein